MTNRNALFGRLLKAGISSITYCEDTTAPVIEAGLGEQIGVASHTIQRYKAGHLPPEARTIQILAEACVRRGFLNREWLQAFLRAAHYPNPDQLIEQLYPQAPTRFRAPRIYTNLPAPGYNQFVMRQQLFDQVLDGLRQRSPVVVIASLGGMGKTSLTREVAAYCVSNREEQLNFDAGVWVSDKDHPGTTNLTIVCDEIARTLDYPGLMQLPYHEKQFEVEQLLRRQKVLLVVDNFETITDSALAGWLLRLPEPSKAIVTTREYQRELRSAWPVDLDGMQREEAQELISNRLKALKLEKLVSDQAQLAPLLAATGGNPMALELALGLIKYEHRPLRQIIDDLYQARGRLFEDLFARVWKLLEGPARQVLLSTVAFAPSAGQAALAAAAGVQGMSFDRAVEQLAELTLITIERVDLQTPPRYSLHPLVRSFAAVQLAKQPAFEQELRQRWIAWYCRLAAQTGFCWDDLQRLELLDHEHETLYTAILWASEHQHDHEAIMLIEGIRYYYNVRGLWDDRLTINQLRADAARRIGDRNNEALALAYHVEIRSKQGRAQEVAEAYPQLEALAQTAGLPDDVLFEVQHARALYMQASGHRRAAGQIWRELLTLSAQLGGQKYVINRRWLATWYYQQGDLDQAQQLYSASLQDAYAINDQRSIVGNSLKLAAIELDRGNTSAAQETLDACRATAERLHDRRRLGEFCRLSARIAAMHGDTQAACEALTTAINLFERLGMQGELSEAQATLNSLSDAYMAV